MKSVECANCGNVVDDYYYTVPGFAMRTCSISCMAEFMYIHSIGHIKVRIDIIKKHILNFRSV
jgi:hypothetical protein